MKQRWIVLFVVMWMTLLASCAKKSTYQRCTGDAECTNGKKCQAEVCVCAFPTIECEGKCIDPRSDAAHCGQCGSVCEAPRVCEQGACACPSGQLDCDGTCTDIKSNPKHCGGCFKGCVSGENCAGGQCVLQCPAPTPDSCEGACVNLQSDPAHCGKCNNACPAGQGCNEGSCRCSQAKILCGESCVDPQNDRNHCGACNNACTANQFCVEGQCLAECPKSTPTVCFGGCVNTQNDVGHCGKCGNQCQGGKRCEEGSCRCPADKIDCGGVCVDPRITRDHCGRCGNKCADGRVCSEGRCLTSCPTKTESICFGGCVDPKTNVDHCGKCGNACAEREICTDGACGCASGQTQCAGRCTDTQTDFQHCGGCGKACQKGQVCAAGKCVASCPASTPVPCSGGCVDTRANPNHCGACGVQCAAGKVCNAGKCACASGLTECNGICTDLKKSSLHCGACGTSCPPGRRCVDGTCTLLCPDDRPSECDGICVNTKSDERNCGSCGLACQGRKRCSDGTCTCPGTLTDCSGACVDLNNNLAHCGKCGDVCKAGERCVSGTCKLDCPQGQAVCSQQCVDTNDDARHCGACGQACKPNQLCDKGQCVCQPGLTLCDGSCVNTDFETTHCGACNNACKTGERCVSGACQLCPSSALRCGDNCCPQNFSCCNLACVDVKTSLSHCGACGNACKLGEACCNGACAPLQTDAKHCGQCGKACAAGQSCCGGACTDLKNDVKHCGACGKTCNANETCCNGTCINTTADAKHCGACGKACAAGQSCCGGACIDLKTSTGHCGACGQACLAGQSCCGGACANITTSTAHCGACGNACGTGENCCNGACIDTKTSASHCGACANACNANEGCCSSACANLQQSTSHCGTCGQACGTGESCCSGACADLQSDAKHCGACGKICNANEGCCSGSCIDQQSDPKNCGACGKTCPTKEICTSGQCGPCPAGAKEVCGNGIDDDCDGIIDDPVECFALSVTNGIADYAVQPDGSIFVVHSGGSNTALRGTCYDNKAQVKKAIFEIAPAVSGQYIERQMIITMPGSNLFAVAWMVRTASGSYRIPHVRLFDAQCNPAAPAVAWPVTTQIEYIYSVAMDKSGNFAILFRNASGQLTVNFYNRQAAPTKTDIVDPSNLCRGNNYRFFIAMAPDGSGVISCQRHYSNPVYYRRFKADGTFEDAALVKLPESEFSKSSYYRTHLLGVNSKRNFVIAWQSREENRINAIFFDSAGNKVKTTVLSKQWTSYTNGYPGNNESVALRNDQFILRDGVYRISDRPTWHLYDEQGSLIAAVRNSYQPFLLRSNGTNVYIVDDKGVIRLIDFPAGAGLCNGQACLCDAGETRACYQGPGSPRAPCQAGSQTCGTDRLSWGACTGQILPELEICGNQKDDNCTGGVDENCPLTNAVPTSYFADYDVAQDGTIVQIGWNGAALVGYCTKPDGTALRPSFVISEPGHYASSQGVKVAKISKAFLVVWDDREASYVNTRRRVFRLFNAQCQPVTPVTAWPTNANINDSYYHYAIGGSGNFALTYYDTSSHLHIAFYDATGKAIGTPTKLDTGSRCRYAARLAFNPQTGDGVVACQYSTCNPILYRRFKVDGSLVGSDWSAVAESDGCKSASSRSHMVGMNAKGEMVIQWQHSNASQDEAVFYNASGALAKHVIIGSRTTNGGAFGYINQDIGLMGSDFVLFDGIPGSYEPRLHRFSSAGVLRSGAPATNFYLQWFRTSQNATYTYDNIARVIRINPFDLSVGKGLCNGKTCVCPPSSTRQCHTTFSTVRGECKHGTQTCSTDGSRWSACVGEVLPGLEICNNQKDDNCDGSVDNNCTQTDRIYARSIHDIDVADNGAIVMAAYNSRALHVTCYNPTLTVRRPTFVVNDLEYWVRDPQVRYSRDGKFMVVAWSRTRAFSSRPISPYLQLFNGTNCQPISGRIALGTNQTSYWGLDVSNSGQIAVAYRGTNGIPVVNFYDATGKLVAGPTPMDASNRCSYAIRIATNPTTGDGVISCQTHYTRPIYYRLFKADGTMLGNESTIVSGSDQNRSSYTRSHILGMNSKGEFAIEWQDYTNRLFMANFYNATGTLVKNVTVSNVMRYNYNAFTYPEERIVLMGDDFVLRDGGRSGTPVTWYRYSPAGNLISKGAWGTSAPSRRGSLRFGNNKIHVIDSNYLRFNYPVFQ